MGVLIEAVAMFFVIGLILAGISKLVDLIDKLFVEKPARTPEVRKLTREQIINRHPDDI